MKALVVQNCEAEGAGTFEDALSDRGFACDRVHAWRGEPLPSHNAHDIVVVCGTPTSANDVERHAWLMEERRYVERALEQERFCLGLCFGGQLLARILGAEVRKNPVLEIGGYDVRLTDAGRTDPLFAGFPDVVPVFQWHGETFAIPPGAANLVEADDCRHQAFRKGRSVALQFHLEVTAADAAAWADAYEAELAAAGKSREQVVAECAERETSMRALSGRLLDNLLAV